VTRLATGCEPLDNLLGGGLEPGAITLVFGEAGTGKTNLCLQAARNAVRDGRGRVGYVDTEGVSLERLEQVSGPDYERVMKGILFFAPQSLEEQEKMVLALAKIKDPGLLIVDSVNMHYRLHLGDEADRTGVSFTKQLGELLVLARRKDVPILITGQVYGDEDNIKPFGGRTMEHIVKTIVRLRRTGAGMREATLIKHRSEPEGATRGFRITADGLE
jgi:DNA repair protein RadB